MCFTHSLLTSFHEVLERVKTFAQKPYEDQFSAGFILYMNTTLVFLCLLSNLNEHFSALYYVASKDVHKGRSTLEGIL